MMAFKDKFIGVLLMFLGLFALLFNIEVVKNYLLSKGFPGFLSPSGFVYPVIILVLGILLFWRFLEN